MPDVTILPDEVHATADEDETLLRALGRAGLQVPGGMSARRMRDLQGQTRPR